MKKLAYLESLRGLAALVVVFNHFAIAFYPAVYFGASAAVHTRSGFELVVSRTPLNLLFNGAFSVALFFVLSGFVLSYKFLRERELPLAFTPLMIKRYVRLLPPVLVSVILAYVLMRFSFLASRQTGLLTGSTHLLSFLRFQPDLGRALYEGFIGSLLRHDATYNGALWTMTFEFFGSLLVFLVVALFRNRRWRVLAYVLVLTLFRSRYYSAFIAGVALCDYYTLRASSEGNARPAALPVAALAIGLFLGSFPPLRPVEGTLYAFLGPYAQARSYHMIGATLVMFGLLNLRPLQSLLSRKAFVFLGKISFSLYILHFLIIASIGCAIFNALASRVSYHAAFFTMFLLTMPIIVAASTLTYRVVDLQGVRLSQAVYASAAAGRERIINLSARLVPVPFRTGRLYAALVADRTAAAGDADTAKE